LPAAKSDFEETSPDLASSGALEELTAVIGDLTTLCDTRCQQWPGAIGQLILLMDGCDNLAQHRDFQDKLAIILERCPACKIILSTQQPIRSTVSGKFKFTPYQLPGLMRVDAVRLFLARLGRQLQWEELPSNSLRARAMAAAGAEDPIDFVTIVTAEVKELIATYLASSGCSNVHGGRDYYNPRRIIELANLVRL